MNIKICVKTYYIFKKLLKNFKNCICYYYFKKKFALPSRKNFYDFHKYFNILIFINLEI